MNDMLQKSKLAPDLVIEREISYPPELVFKAWTDQNALRKWMGPGKVCAPGATMDARVGGAYVFPMHRPDGVVTTVRGVIKEIVPNRKLRLTWSWDDKDGKPGEVSEVTLEFIRPPPALGSCFAMQASPIRRSESSMLAVGAVATTRSKCISPASSGCPAINR